MVRSGLGISGPVLSCTWTRPRNQNDEHLPGAAFAMANKKGPAATSESPDRALIAAIEQNDLGGVQDALRGGANANAKKGSSTALQLTLRTHGSEPILCALLEAGADARSMRDRLVWAICT